MIQKSVTMICLSVEACLIHYVTHFDVNEFTQK